MDNQLEVFLKMCRDHDLTYSYSDDHRYFMAGHHSLLKILDFAKTIDADDAARIWNQVVDEKIKKGSRGQYYWGDKTEKVTI